MKRQPMRIAQIFRDDRGITGSLFAILAFAMITMTLGGLDFIRFHMVSERVQWALDGATLAIGHRLDSDTLQTDAETFFWANVSNGYMSADISVPSVDVEGTALTGQTVSMDVNVDFPLLVTSLLGVDVWSFTMHTKAKRETTNVELVLAMDNTGSMNNDGKLEAMQSAATTLITTLMGGEGITSRSGVAIGVVPFTTVVRLPDYSDWLEDTSDVVTLQYKNGSVVTAKYTTTNSNGNGKGNNGRNTTTSTSYPVVDSTFDPDTDWNGCFSESTDNSLSDLSLTHDGESLPPFIIDEQTVCLATQGNSCTEIGTEKVFEDSYCTTQAVQFLDTDSSKATSAIESMTASGQTAVFTGMLWAWRMLSPDWNAIHSWGSETLPADKDSSLTKAVVLLTDGDNSDLSNTTSDPYDTLYPTLLGRGTTDTVSNSALSTLCTEAKDDGVVIYTIAFGDDANSGEIKDLMENCATSSSYFYSAPSTADLEDAFSNIGDSLSRLSLVE